MDSEIAEDSIGGATHVIEPHGEIDLASAAKVKAAVDAAADAGACYVIVDLEDVGFVDSTGIGVLLSSQRKLQARGGNLIVVCSDPLILRVFEVTSLIKVLNVTPSRHDALLAVQRLGQTG
jgi:anti-sigma B factor antagonist